MKIFHCRDMGIDCEWVARAETEEELMERAEKHGREVHKLEITPEIMQKARQMVREE
jgi:predicted small metal-binding protein